LRSALADDQKGKHPDDDENSSAADEPTAVWDAEALRAAGLDDLGPLPDPSVPPPATPASATATAPSIVVDRRATGEFGVAKPDAAVEPKKELSWAATMGIALGLGAIVYALIRIFR
jgi:hypothetical protein